MVTVVPAGWRRKISVGPAVVGAGCWAKGAVLMEMRLCTEGTSDIQRFVVAREIAKD